jgi:hypothetical protein
LINFSGGLLNGEFMEKNNTVKDVEKPEPFEYDAELRNWSLVHLFSGGMCVFGRMHFDKKGRFSDGTTVRTSPIVSLTNGQLVTKNSKYLLVNE